MSSEDNKVEGSEPITIRVRDQVSQRKRGKKKHDEMTLAGVTFFTEVLALYRPSALRFMPLSLFHGQQTLLTFGLARIGFFSDWRGNVLQNKEIDQDVQSL